MDVSALFDPMMEDKVARLESELAEVKIQNEQLDEQVQTLRISNELLKEKKSHYKQKFT